MGLDAEWTEVDQTEIQLQEQVSHAKAKVYAADDDLDVFANRFSKAVLTITNDNRSHPLYVHFFGKKTLRALQRLVFRGQLEAMRAWIPSVQARAYPARRPSRVGWRPEPPARDRRLRSRASTRASGKRLPKGRLPWRITCLVAPCACGRPSPTKPLPPRTMGD